MIAPVFQLWVTSAWPVSGPSVSPSALFLLKDGKGCALELGLPLKQVIQKFSCHVERENMDRTMDSLLVLETMLPLDLTLARCALFWALPAQPNTFSPSFCFLSESELEDLTATPGMVCTALPSSVCGKGRGQIPEQHRGLGQCKGREEHTAPTASTLPAWQVLGVRSCFSR